MNITENAFGLFAKLGFTELLAHQLVNAPKGV